MCLSSHRFRLKQINQCGDSLRLFRFEKASGRRKIFYFLENFSKEFVVGIVVREELEPKCLTAPVRFELDTCLLCCVIQLTALFLEHLNPHNDESLRSTILWKSDIIAE